MSLVTKEGEGVQDQVRREGGGAGRDEQQGPDTALLVGEEPPVVLWTPRFHPEDDLDLALPIGGVVP